MVRLGETGKELSWFGGNIFLVETKKKAEAERHGVADKIHPT
jgi:hypothetical protein